MQLTPHSIRRVLAALLAMALLTACASETVTLTAAPPSGSPRPTLAARQTVFIANTDRLGADFRQTPGPAGALIRRVPENAVFEATGRQQQAQGQIWGEIRDSTGIVGWVLLDYLTATPPAGATSTPVTLGLDASPPPTTPTSLPEIDLAPTATQRTVGGPRPQDTLVPTLPPAPAPVLRPLPPDATPRPATPTLPRLAPAAATSSNFDVDATPTRRPATPLAPTPVPAATLVLTATRVPIGR